MLKKSRHRRRYVRECLWLPTIEAKAAAVYNALYGDGDTELGMDIIAQPQFRLKSNGIPLITKQVCASVIGYRAVVESIKN